MGGRRVVARALLPGLIAVQAAGLVPAAMAAPAPGPPMGMAAAPASRFVDAVLAEVGREAVTASDVALARALGLFGMSPSDAPIGAADVEHLVRAHVALAEADRLAIAPAEAEVETAWGAVAGRLGGAGALRAWLDDEAIEARWARALVERDLAWRRFVEVRFAAFVFVTDDEVTAALGPGPHRDDAVGRTRDALRARATRQRLDEWMTDALARTTVRRLLPLDGRVPCPLLMPGSGR